MAKPIFIAHVLQEMAREQVNSLTRNLESNSIGKDYHILVVNDLPSTANKPVSFECFNDCKGLEDKDIEKLLLEIINER